MDSIYNLPLEYWITENSLTLEDPLKGTEVFMTKLEKNGSLLCIKTNKQKTRMFMKTLKPKRIQE